MIDWIDETSEQLGTEFSRENMMAIQGFEKLTTVFNGNTITETNKNGQTTTTTFNDNSIVETFVGEKNITKTTTFNNNTITEVIS